MLSFEDLVNSFYRVEHLTSGLVRAGEELPARTYHSYFQLGDDDRGASFVTSENFIDDDFAALVLAHSPARPPAMLQKLGLRANRYGFTHLLHVPPHYHRELVGRLDTQREAITLCIPIFEPEFSGTETVDEFFELRRRRVATQDWRRKVTPRIMLRYDNGKTGSGAADYFPASFDMVMLEVDNLLGAPNGFIDLMNYRGDVVELLFDHGETYRWIADRNDAGAALIAKAEVRERLWQFLTR